MRPVPAASTPSIIHASQPLVYRTSEQRHILTRLIFALHSLFALPRRRAVRLVVPPRRNCPTSPVGKSCASQITSLSPRFKTMLCTTNKRLRGVRQSQRRQAQAAHRRATFAVMRRKRRRQVDIISQKNNARLSGRKGERRIHKIILPCP